MPWIELIYSDDDEAHLAEHGVTIDEVRQVLEDPIRTAHSRTTWRPIAFGFTRVGRLIAVVYEQIDGVPLRPITAYDVED